MLILHPPLFSSLIDIPVKHFPLFVKAPLAFFALCYWNTGKACPLCITRHLKLYIVICWWKYLMGMIFSPQSSACWPSPWPSLWVGSQRCSERRRTQWVPQTQTHNRSRSRRLTPWWLTLEAGKSGRLPSAWSWWEQLWSLWKENRHKAQIRVLWGFSHASGMAIWMSVCRSDSPPL